MIKVVLDFFLLDRFVGVGVDVYTKLFNFFQNNLKIHYWC